MNKGPPKVPGSMRETGMKIWQHENNELIAGEILKMVGVSTVMKDIRLKYYGPVSS